MLTRLMAFNADYAAAIDDDRLEDWPLFFSESCRYRITSRRNLAEGLRAGLIYADSRAMLADRVRSLRKANVYERQRYRHLIGMPRIVGTGADAMQVQTPFAVIRIVRDDEAMLFVSGCYADELEQTGDGLRLRARDVICDSSRIDTLLALPL